MLSLRTIGLVGTTSCRFVEPAVVPCKVLVLTVTPPETGMVLVSSLAAVTVLSARLVPLMPLRFTLATGIDASSTKVTVFCTKSFAVIFLVSLAARLTTAMGSVAARSALARAVSSVIFKSGISHVPPMSRSHCCPLV